jgi:hypothetical protein
MKYYYAAIIAIYFELVVARWMGAVFVHEASQTRLHV